MHTTKPFVPESSAAEVEVGFRNLKGYISPGVDQVPAELIKAGGEALSLEIHKSVKLHWKKVELPHQ